MSPSGDRIASASRDKTIKHWDVKGECLKTFKGHTDAIYSINFSADNKLAISSGKDKRILIWELVEPYKKWILYDKKLLHNFKGVEYAYKKPIMQDITLCTCNTICTCDTIIVPTNSIIPTGMVCTCNTITVYNKLKLAIEENERIKGLREIEKTKLLTKKREERKIRLAKERKERKIKWKKGIMERKINRENQLAEKEKRRKERRGMHRKGGLTVSSSSGGGGVCICDKICTCNRI